MLRGVLFPLSPSASLSHLGSEAFSLDSRKRLGADMCHATETIAPLFSSSLDPLETTESFSDSPPPGICGFTPTLSESFRHSGWQAQRQRVYDALRSTNQSVSRISAFVDCGIDAYVLRSREDPTKFRLAGSHCHDRLCLPCARDRSRAISAAVLAKLAGQPCRFLTLTLKHTGDTLRSQLDRITRCFSKLRQRAFWKKRVTGGVGFIELKWSTKTDAWHVHIHCLLHGRYLPQVDVSRLWYAITGDSRITDIRFVRDNRQAARYVAKYASKPFDRFVLSQRALLQDVVLATKGKRLVLAFGDWKGVQVTHRPSEAAWENLGHVEDIALKAKLGDSLAVEALSLLLGDRYHEYLAYVPLPEPRPPPKHPPNIAQLTFAWYADVASFAAFE